MAAELNWDTAKKQSEWANARKFLVSMGLPEVGKLPGDGDFGKSSKRAFFGEAFLGRIAAAVPGIAPSSSSSTSGDAPLLGQEATRAHFNLEELAQIKDAYIQRLGGAVDDETKGVTTGELLALVRDDLGYARAGTGVGEVLGALRDVGVSVGEADGRTFSFDEVVDVSLPFFPFFVVGGFGFGYGGLMVCGCFLQVAATFKEAAGQKIMTESASRMLTTTAIPVEKSGGGV